LPFSSGSGIAYHNGSAYIVGFTNTTDFPVSSGTYPCCVNPVWNGVASFVEKLADDTTGGTTTGTTAFTRVEQNSSSVTYTGTWYANTGSFNSGGSAALAENPGSRATFTFTGTAVSWIGYKDAWSGIANVYIDGALKTQVDGYSPSAQAQAVMFSVTGLSSGSHTVTVEAKGTKNPASHAAWIWVDAFDFASGTTGSGGTTGGGTGVGSGNTGGTFTRVEQTSSAVTYTGTWYSNSGSFNSGGNAALAVNSGARATLTFRGTAVKWIGYRDAWSGIANVYIDGVLKSQVDTYASSAQAQAVNFAITGLNSGNHTITIEATGAKDASARSAWVWVDAFDFLP
jgi:alpha-amylase